MKRAPLNSRDFRKMKRAPLEIQILRNLNETRTPKFWQDWLLRGASNTICPVVQLTMSYVIHRMCLNRRPDMTASL